MDSYEWNKIAGAVLSALLLFFGLPIIAHAVFHVEKPETPGYVIEVAASVGGAAEEEEVVTVAELLPTADVAEGEKITRQRCVTCHSLVKGGAQGLGPNLWEIVERPMGAVDGFRYSPAMSGYGESWTFDNLDGFLERPSRFMRGTGMSFAGLRDPEDRADVIAFLRVLSDSPVDLPEAPVAEEPPAPAEEETAG